ncbi:aminodeoxychorismate synthase component I [Lentilitoribacter sp. Alg239-R112]|uniref:aminodeoxychorismate synthase component I n=1 Tax=Lentilitoribacter sp. Alg239-R112 TaxID=2305987 RepID=UPI0013A6A2D6|nr:aminodeoxychorismate synthase component I [Lentilitoribacter sp. Alg239-R112]
MDISTRHIMFRDEIAGTSLSFESPHDIITAHTPEELIDVLREIELQSASGNWVAGYLSYEAGYCFEEKLKKIIPSNRRAPLACFGIFDNPSSSTTPATQAPADTNRTRFDRPVPLWDFDTYAEKFDQLTQHMKIGNCYQGNLTFPMTSQWQGNPFELFERLRDIQPVNHAAFVDLGGPIILSRSPEMFFQVDQEGWIESRPMKGTAPRGTTKIEDQAIITTLKNDPKNLSENVMIVDLLRNDISHICDAGSVCVPQLYELKTYATLHQLVSRVRGKVKAGTRFADIVQALFPCGSITGAPKIRTMEILTELEDHQPRDVYCGAIGWIAPSGAMQFNVPIRTISLYDDQTALFNVGGGVTLESTAKSEYEECLTKAKFATELAKISN